MTVRKYTERGQILVSYIDYAELQCKHEATVTNLTAQVQGLAAESAALKDINSWCKTDAFKNAYREFKKAEALGCPDVDCMHDAMLAALMHSPETPATDAALAEIRNEALIQYANKTGFSFQHGSIHAHFGNGNVMVGSVTFDDGAAGINFAPVREKLGGVGTDYEWTKGKNTDDVDSVFVISSSNAAGLQVIRNKLDEAIDQLRKEQGND